LLSDSRKHCARKQTRLPHLHRGPERILGNGSELQLGDY
jgi:hypothetical protein